MTVATTVTVRGTVALTVAKINIQWTVTGLESFSCLLDTK